MITAHRLFLRRPAALRAVAPLRSRTARARRLSTEPQGGGQTTPSHEQGNAAAHQGASRWRSPVRLVGIFLGSALSFYATSAYLERTREPAPAQEKQARRKRKAKLRLEPDPAPALIAGASDSEQARRMLSSQHAQVANSWERPGVWAWGNNTGRVVDPEDDSAETVVKSPRRIRFFDGQVLRDLRMTKDVGVAVTEKGDLVQWGRGFSKENPQPAPTLVGKDIAKVAVTQDRVIALSSDGAVYSLPASRGDQADGLKPLEQQPTGWFRSSLWTSSPGGPLSASVSYRDVTPLEVSGREKVVDISGGRVHCLMLTSRGRVFAAAASTLGFPSHGQLGVPGLSWLRRPKDRPYDTLHEVAGLRGNSFVGIAAGDYHSLALDRDGRVWAWGDNTFGQLGFDTAAGYPAVEAATLMPTNELFAGTGLVPTVTLIAAGGTTTYFATDAIPAVKVAGDAKPVADLWACGQGVNGQLGNGRWSHVSGMPTKVKNVSSLTEYDERAKRLVPIRLASVSAGTTHACAVMGNITKTDERAGSGRTADDTNWGADVMVWGGNEHFQLGTGRRSNSNKPVYVAPLDAKDEGGAGSGHERMQLAPRSVVRIGGSDGRKVSVEQKVVCGEYVTAVYSAT